MKFKTYNLDCRDVMDMFLEDNSVDSIVTDPPYGLSFMGKGWDHGVPSVEFWERALRVLKPGGHLLAFGGSRTYHWLAANIETAGFEIRDQIMWVYGSGFPKSLDVSKAIDKAAGAEREVVGIDVKKAKQQTRAVDTAAYGDYAGNAGEVTAPSTDAAQQWDGWGTALKPAHEPICVARKPLIGTVAANVLAHGTGAINIDGCRVGTDDKLGGGHCGSGQQMAGGWERPWMSDTEAVAANAERSRASVAKSENLGRWPANLIHDGSVEVTSLFPVTTSGSIQPHHVRTTSKTKNSFSERSAPPESTVGSTGSASRFFYVPKASQKDRDEGMGDAPVRVMAMSNQAKAELARGNMHEGDSGMNSAKLRQNNHPTVKPTDLMAYLCRLVTPPGGIVLDPFMGSGSTGKAALREGFRFIGCELEAEYHAIADARLKAEL